MEQVVNIFKKIAWFLLSVIAAIIGVFALVIFCLLTYMAFSFFAVAGAIEESMIVDDPDIDLLEDEI